jgi:predicted GNAT superfamily acetyltransferase
MPIIRRLQAADHAAVLRINDASVPAVARLDEHELQRLAAIGELHRVAVDDQGIVLGYMLAFASDEPYDGSEFRHFNARLSQPFLYVDQIAIAASGQRQGIGLALYESLAGEARARHSTLMCCEVNVIPPNPGSMAFHLRLGFRQYDALAVEDGRSVVLLARDTSRFN